MKSMALFGKEDIRPVPFELPEPTGGDLVIKVVACGVCGSDLRMYYTGPTPRYKVPVVLGHEISAQVVKVGPNVKDFQVGEHVALAPLIPCMHCPACVRGEDNLCANNIVIGTTVDGGFSEQMYIPEAMLNAGGLVKAPAGVDVNEFTMAETLACCLHGLRLIPYTIGQRVLIIGDGPIGLSFLQLAHMMGAAFVATSGRRAYRRHLALSLGADAAVDAAEGNLTSQFKQPFDIVIISNSDINTVSMAFGLIRPGGHILLFSGYTYGTTLNIDPNIVHYRELQIHGSIDATVRDFNDAVNLFPHLRMKELISDSFPLDEIVSAFHYAKNAEVVKVIVTP